MLIATLSYSKLFEII